MFLDTDRSHARTTATVRYAEGLVEVQMGDVAAVVAGPTESDLGVHIGTVEVYLTARLVHELAHVADRLLEHAVRRGIGDHQTGEIVLREEQL